MVAKIPGLETSEWKTLLWKVSFFSLFSTSERTKIGKWQKIFGRLFQSIFRLSRRKLKKKSVIQKKIGNPCHLWIFLRKVTVFSWNTLEIFVQSALYVSRGLFWREIFVKKWNSTSSLSLFESFRYIDKKLLARLSKLLFTSPEQP